MKNIIKAANPAGESHGTRYCYACWKVFGWSALVRKDPEIGRGVYFHSNNGRAQWSCGWHRGTAIGRSSEEPME